MLAILQFAQVFKKRIGQSYAYLLLSNINNPLAIGHIFAMFSLCWRMLIVSGLVLCNTFRRTYYFMASISIHWLSLAGALTLYRRRGNNE